MEFLAVDALNEILLPPFIFLETFCFLCCQVAEPITALEPITDLETYSGDSSSPTILDKGSETVTETVTEAVAECDKFCDESEEIIAVTESPQIPHEEILGETEIPQIEESVVLEESMFSNSEEVEKIAATLDNMTKRQARKLMGGLGLQLKRNGVELSTEQKIANIKREFKTNHQTFVQIVHERLPEIINTQEDTLKAAS